MSLNVYDWINQIVVEGIKYVLLAHWFFGFEFSRKKNKYFVILYLVALPLLASLDILEKLWFYRFVWGAVLLLFLFQGEIIEKIKAYFMIWFLVALVDSVLVMFYIMIPELLFTSQDKRVVMIIGCIGAALWGFLVWKGKGIQRYIQNFWRKLSNGEYILLLVVLILLSLTMGGMQSNLDDTMTISMKEATFISCVLAACIFMILLILFFYTKQSKKRLEEVNQLNIRYLELQKKYYENALKQYEDMRSFRHEINHHIYMLSGLSQENKIAGLKEYINNMAESYQKMRGIHTGNFIADCIISYTLNELQEKEQFQFYLDGHFPEKFFLEDIDFCVLLSNILDNAKEALMKVTGECVLQIEIKGFRQWFYLTVRNSVEKGAIDFRHTSKSDTRYHGYGVQNIRRIVEKYFGTVTWKLEDGMVEVKIIFDKNRLK